MFPTYVDPVLIRPGDNPTDDRFPLVSFEPRLIMIKPRVSPAFPFLTFLETIQLRRDRKKRISMIRNQPRLRFNIFRLFFKKLSKLMRLRGSYDLFF